MSELALRKYLADQLTADLVLPTGTGRYKSFTAHRQMLKREVLGAHVVLQVGRMQVRERRMDGARSIGVKEAHWTVDLLVVANGKDADADGDDFSALVDNVKKVFRQKVTIPATLTDPQTSETSTLTYVGETLDAETLEPDMETVQGRILYRARITLDAREVLTPY